jgi:hypothetical protein
VIRIGTSASLPAGYLTRTVTPAGPASGATAAAAMAAAVEQLAGLLGGAPPRVIVLSESAPPALQMPAAGLSAESGAPILFVTAAGVPAATAAVLRSLGRPAIYLIGASTVAASTLAQLAHFGPLARVAGSSAEGASRTAPESSNPVANAISVARFAAGSFGWGVHEAGHGLVFANPSRPLDAPAAAPLAAHGDYAPLLLLERSDSVPPALAHYLADIQPGYTRAIGPVRGVYNHGWLIGDENAISAVAQAEIDTLLEIAPRAGSSAEVSVPPTE